MKTPSTRIFDTVRKFSACPVTSASACVQSYEHDPDQERDEQDRAVFTRQTRTWPLPARGRT